MAKKNVVWAPGTQAQTAAMDRETALRILHAIDEYLTNGTGDVKKLQPLRDDLRLSVGDYRIFFYSLGLGSIRITSVKHRSEAYR